MFIPNRKDWKKRGIKDEDMETVDYIGDKDSSKEDRNALKKTQVKALHQYCDMPFSKQELVFKCSRVQL